LVTDTSSKSMQPFKIYFVLAENTTVDTLQTAIVKYLNNLPYLKTMAEVERSYHTTRLKYIENDLARLDTLKTEYNRFLASSKIPSSVYNNAINPAEFYEQSANLLNLRDHAMRMLYVEDNAISVIGPLRLVKARRSAPLYDLVLIIGSIGLFAGFLFGLLIETKNVVLRNENAR
jgi:hypothetical protein